MELSRAPLGAAQEGSTPPARGLLLALPGETVLGLVNVTVTGIGIYRRRGVDVSSDDPPAFSKPL